jgi:nucleoid-associated protein YgaU
MELENTNPYANSNILEFADGTSELERIPYEYTVTGNETTHIIHQKDTLDSIAHTYYQDFTENAVDLWIMLAEINGIDYPLDLSPYVGKKLIIPDFFDVIK